MDRVGRAWRISRPEVFRGLLGKWNFDAANDEWNFLAVQRGAAEGKRRSFDDYNKRRVHHGPPAKINERSRPRNNGNRISVPENAEAASPCASPVTGGFFLPLFFFLPVFRRLERSFPRNAESPSRAERPRY